MKLHTQATALLLALAAGVGSIVTQAASSACAPPDGVLDIAIVNLGGNQSFWQSTALESHLDADGPSNRTYISGSSINSATLASYDVVVLTGPNRAWVNASSSAALVAWVQAGGTLIVDPLFSLSGADPALAPLGPSYYFEWLGWSGDWCGYSNQVQYPDPNHSLVTTPTALGTFGSCDHISGRTSTLGSAWTAVGVVPSHYTGSITPLAVAQAGAGAVIAAGVHFDHFTPGQFRLARNAARYCGVAPNEPPVAQCQNVAVNTDAGACSATVSASAFDAGSYDPEGGEVTVTVSPAGPYPVGVTSVTVTVTDEEGASSSCSATVTVTDAEPPVVSGASVDKPVLWPPNHQMITVNVGHTSSDNCGVTGCSLSVSSNEPQNGLGDGDTDNDWVVVDDHTVQLRAERAGGGSGRIYTITITCVDAAGNSSSTSTTVTVPHSKKK